MVFAVGVSRVDRLYSLAVDPGQTYSKHYHSAGGSIRAPQGSIRQTSGS
jgi:hypothetical protein